MTREHRNMEDLYDISATIIGMMCGTPKMTFMFCNPQSSRTLMIPGLLTL